MASGALQILIVDDDPADVELMREALDESELVIDLHVVHDGVDAMAFLKRSGRFQDAVTPDLILLDLNMPRRDGRAVLEDIRQDNNLRHLVVVVLTTSDAEEEILRSYQLGANCYVTKPMGMVEFEQVVRMIDHFWFTLVRLPPRPTELPPAGGILVD